MLKVDLIHLQAITLLFVNVLYFAFRFLNTNVSLNFFQEKLSVRQKWKTTNPEKYSEYLEKQRERNRNIRNNVKLLKQQMKEGIAKDGDRQKVEHYDSKAKERQSRFKSKKLADRSSNDEGKRKEKQTPTGVKTRKEIASRRKKWRERKKTYRAKLTPQKQRWVREREKRRKQKVAEGKKDKRMQISTEGLFTKKQQIYNQASKVKKMFTSENECFEVLAHMENKMSPEKKSRLHRLTKRTKYKLRKRQNRNNEEPIKKYCLQRDIPQNLDLRQ